MPRGKADGYSMVARRFPGKARNATGLTQLAENTNNHINHIVNIKNGQIHEGGTKSAQLPGSKAITVGDAMVRPKSDSHRKKQRGRSANSAHDKELPTEHWAHAVAMFDEKSKAAALESKKQLPEDFSASDFDVVRGRARSR